MKKFLSLLKNHNAWRQNCVNLIASENVMSPFCESLYVSDLMHRYAEGLPFERYYQGLKYVDEIESLAEEKFKEHFGANFVDIRPISGTSANMAVFSALAERGDPILTLGIQGGSHVSHEKAGAAGILGFKSFDLGFDGESMMIDLEKSEKKIIEIKPKFIVIGGSVILFPQPVKELRKICDQVGAKIIYDAAHVFGLITAGFFQNPLEEGVDIITSSTHKTFPGPQGGIILGNIEKDLQRKIQGKVFPGVLSNHHLHRIPPLYFALEEMEQFGKDYVSQILKNSKALAKELNNLGFAVLGKEKGWTESHQVVVNVEKQGRGDFVAKKLEEANIILNKNIIPKDSKNPENPTGIRLGVQEMTRYGMKEEEMKKIAELIKKVILDKEDIEIIKDEVIEFRKKFQEINYCLKEN
ncbi:serine hydroxymethyltransferase [Candidatus Parcubacteria bacterium]|nr:serine hydroxymethyltransferase [Candidatus Parcubacteria bacterium]